MACNAHLRSGSLLPAAAAWPARAFRHAARNSAFCSLARHLVLSRAAFAARAPIVRNERSLALLRLIRAVVATLLLRARSVAASPHSSYSSPPSVRSRCKGPTTERADSRRRPSPGKKFEQTEPSTSVELCGGLGANLAALTRRAVDASVARAKRTPQRTITRKTSKVRADAVKRYRCAVHPENKHNAEPKWGTEGARGSQHRVARICRRHRQSSEPADPTPRPGSKHSTRGFARRHAGDERAR